MIETILSAGPLACALLAASSAAIAVNLAASALAWRASRRRTRDLLALARALRDAEAAVTAWLTAVKRRETRGHV